MDDAPSVLIPLRMRGAVIAVLDLPGGKGPDAVAELGGPATFHPCDVTDEHATEAALESVIEAHGAMHVAVNTAGGGWSKRIIGRDGPLPPQRDGALMGPARVSCHRGSPSGRPKAARG